MSVLLEFAMFPTDKGESVSNEVSQVIEAIRNLGFPYQLTPMGTIIETETMREATSVLNSCYNVLDEQCDRVYCSAKFDIRKGKGARMKQKLESIELKIGKVNQ